MGINWLKLARQKNGLLIHKKNRFWYLSDYMLIEKLPKLPLGLEFISRFKKKSVKLHYIHKTFRISDLHPDRAKSMLDVLKEVKNYKVECQLFTSPIGFTVSGQPVNLFVNLSHKIGLILDTNYRFDSVWVPETNDILYRGKARTPNGAVMSIWLERVSFDTLEYILNSVIEMGDR